MPVLTGTPTTLEGKLEVLSDLQLPIGGAAASGSLVFAGMPGMDPQDIDVLCDQPTYFKYALHPQAEWRTTKTGTRTFAIHSAEFFTDLPGMLSEFAPSVEEALATTQLRWGIPFLSVTCQRDWKARVGRPKDIEHVRLVDEFLASRAPLPGL
jgi:hypothetical protein